MPGSAVQVRPQLPISPPVCCGRGLSFAVFRPSLWFAQSGTGKWGRAEMATATATGGTTPELRRVIVAATSCHVLEWFDFLVYGFFAVYLAEVFFPAKDPTVSLLVTFGTFGLAYLVRPLGAIFIGTYSDRAGRKAGLTLSIGLMLIGTALMVVTPGYATI